MFPFPSKSPSALDWCHREGILNLQICQQIWQETYVAFTLEEDTILSMLVRKQSITMQTTNFILQGIF